MAFISVTRLRVRSLLYMPGFLWTTWRSARQAERAPGFLGGKLMREPKNAFWTITAWESEAAMNAFRIAGAHSSAMSKLLNWCDEAAVGNWNQDTPELPTWQEAHRRMVTEGRLSKVSHPSSAQTAKQIAGPKPSRITGVLKPVERR